MKASDQGRANDEGMSIAVLSDKAFRTMDRPGWQEEFANIPCVLLQGADGIWWCEPGKINWIFQDEKCDRAADEYPGNTRI